jgi:hypothetical protein
MGPLPIITNTFATIFLGWDKQPCIIASTLVVTSIDECGGGSASKHCESIHKGGTNNSFFALEQALIKHLTTQSKWQWTW